MTQKEAVKDIEAAARNLNNALERMTCAVLNARAAGCSWRVIAEPLDVSPQAAWQYYSKVT